MEEVQAAPEGPGVLALLHGGVAVPERVIWAESSESVRRRLIEMLTAAQPEPRASWLGHGGLRFRAAAARARSARTEALAAVRRRAATPLASMPCPDR